MHDFFIAAAVAVMLGLAALVTLAVLVVRRVALAVARARQRMRGAIPRSLGVPGPAAWSGTWLHWHRRAFDVRVWVSTGTRRQSLLVRRELWTHVDRAHAALMAARQAEAPVGELPHLTRQLQELALRSDGQLALWTPSSPAGDVERARDEARRIMVGADKVYSAALDALQCVSHADADRLLGVLERETVAVGEGAARLRSVSAG